MLDQYIKFFKPYFENNREAVEFVKACEGVSGKKENARFMLHQTYRLVTLADDIDKARPRDSLKLLFLIICAEAVAKLYSNYTGEGQSRHYVCKFFFEFCKLDDLKLLDDSFSSQKLKQSQAVPLNRWDAVNLLYDIRCSIVHEGRYWEFHFHKQSLDDPTFREGLTSSMRQTKRDIITTRISYKKFRDIIVKNSIKAIQDYMLNREGASKKAGEESGKQDTILNCKRAAMIQ